MKSFARFSRNIVALAVLLAVQPVQAEPVAQPPVNANVIAEMMGRQQQMQAELGELRDLVERQGHELEMLKRANKQAYADTDQRLTALESQGKAAGATLQAAAPVSGAATSATAPSPAAPGAAANAAPAVIAATAEDQAKYDQGLKELRAGQYPAAIKTFEQVIKVNPPSPNRPNALYWTGEAYVVMGDLKSALAAFERVVKESPAHQKAADAELKMGYIYYDQKNYARARETLNRVKTQFPGTQAATLAEQRLKRMQSEGV